MRRLLSIIISLITVMAFAQQPVESTSNESDPMLRIGKSYLGTRYVANTLDRNEVEQLVINTKEVDCLTFVEYTLAHWQLPVQMAVWQRPDPVLVQMPDLL